MLTWRVWNGVRCLSSKSWISGECCFLRSRDKENESGLLRQNHPPRGESAIRSTAKCPAFPGTASDCQEVISKQLSRAKYVLLHLIFHSQHQTLCFQVCLYVPRYQGTVESRPRLCDETQVLNWELECFSTHPSIIIAKPQPAFHLPCREIRTSRGR